MERREKQARNNSLQELKRLRTEGGSRLTTLAQPEDDLMDASVVASSMQDDDYEDEDGFVERDDGTPVGAHKRPSSFFLKPRPAVPIASATNGGTMNVKQALEGDSYFQSLINQLDEELSSEIEPEGKQPSITATSAPKVNDAFEDMLMDIPDDLSPSPAMGMLMSDAPPLSSEYAPPDDFFDEILPITASTTSGNGGNWMELDGDSPPLTTNPIPMVEIKMSNNSTDLHSNLAPLNTPVSVAEGSAVDFYWIDAFERHNGVILLFGKIRDSTGKGYLSCCLQINNMRRNVFFLPRECHRDDPNQEVSLKDVFEEISSVAAQWKLPKFGCKRVSRKYAFEIPDIPVEADYIKMVYPYECPTVLPKDLTGNTFSHVFGTNTSALEAFLVKRKIMGPCWLRFTPSSTAKKNVEMELDDPKGIAVVLNAPEAPPMSVMSLTLRTIIDPVSKQHEVAAISGLLFKDVDCDHPPAINQMRADAMFSVVREVDGLGFTTKFTETLNRLHATSGGGKLEVAKNEKSLLSFLIAMLYRADPDVIVGHNFLGFDLGVLLHRMRTCKVDFWSRLGRLNFSQ